MHVLFVISSLKGGGAERVTVNLANYWSDAGRQVGIVTLSPRTASDYKLRPAVDVVSLENSGGGYGAASGIIANGKRIARIRREIKRINPDIVIGVMPTGNVLAALACLGLRPLVAGWEQIFPPHAELGRAWNLARKVGYRFLDVAVCLTEEADVWLKENTLRVRGEVIPNPVRVPVPAFDPTVPPALVCRPGRNIILAVGRLSPQKCFADLIEIFSRVARNRPDWDLVVVGEGPERQALEGQVKSTGLSDRVFLPGHVGNIQDWYQRSAIFAMTSKFEGFPVALLEAMASGLAAISYDCPQGPREIIREGINGHLVRLGDNAGFVGILTTLMDDSVLRMHLGKQAKNVADRYSEERISAQWDALFKIA